MGRWSQERRRGADFTEGSGLPQGPDPTWWTLLSIASEIACRYDSAVAGLGTHFEARTRNLTVDPAWYTTIPLRWPTTPGTELVNQIEVVQNNIYQGQIRWTDSAGNPKSQWGPWQQVLGIE